MATKKNTTVNGSEYFRITRTIGHKIVDGKKVPIKKQFLGSSKRNAEQKYEAWKEEQRKKNARIIDDGKTFGEVATYFSENVLAIDSSYARTTREKYISTYKKHVALTGKDKPDEELSRNVMAKIKNVTEKPIVDITAEDIQMMYNALPVSESVINSLHKFMKLFCKWLVRNRYSENFMDVVVIPDKENTRRTNSDEIIVRTNEEMQQIVAKSQNHRLRFLMILSYCTGMRISELFGLKYSDFSEDFVRIDRQYCDGEFSPPKNDSCRFVPLNNMAKKELKTHKAWHEKEMQKRGYTTPYIFTTSHGTLLDRRNAKRALDRFYAANGFEQKKFHAFRATFCTNLCNAGVPIQTASKLMGHKSIEVTARYYTAINDDAKIDAVNKLPDFSNV